MLDGLIAFGTSFLGAGAAVLALRLVPLPRWTRPRGEDGHEHRFDTMVSDGKGWRCGICSAVKAPRLRRGR